MMESLATRLASGKRILLDGGAGSELQRRGVNVSRGYDAKGNIGPWSSVANMTAPDVVRQVHADYLEQGADVVTINTFYGSRSRMAVAGLEDRWEGNDRRAVELALKARDMMNPRAHVVCGVAPSPGPVDSYDDLRAQSELLAGAGVDGRLRADGGPMEQVVEALADEDVRVDAILLMCSAPEEISRTIPRLRAAFDGPIGAYANVGYVGAKGAGGDDPVRQLRAFDLGDNTPERYAGFGGEWLDMGAQIVGGCCTTTPDHIAALRPIVMGEH